MEHLAHFGLALDPFVNDPLLRFYFASPEHSDAERRLLRAVQQGKNLATLLGEVGCGKTMLMRHLLEGLEHEQYEASLLVMLHGGVRPGWLLSRVAQQLGVETPPSERSALVGQIYDRLAAVREEGRQAVVLVDEAQMLASREAMEELRGLLNLEYEERHLVSVVLVGLPSLDEVLALDPALAQRVEVRVRLAPLDSASAAAYLAHRIRTVQGDPAILGADAVEALVCRGRGVPRLLNTLADNALYEAFLAGRKRVAEADVERAARDLGLEDPGVPVVALGADWDQDQQPDRTDPASRAEDLAAESSDSLELDLPSAAEPLSEGSFGEEAEPVLAQEPSAAEMLTEPMLAEEPAVLEPLEAEPAFALPEDGPPKEGDDIDDLFADLVDKR
jgi:type II secretory pathway predicted ATPase ExeA